MNKSMPIGARVDKTFPVGETEDGRFVKREGEHADLPPAFREKQRAAIKAVSEAIEDDDINLVVLNAPTGAGKSLIIYTASKITRGDSFITTPLNSLVDQMDNDEFMDGDIMTIKGRNNYDCVHPKDRGTSVDEAICQRQSSFECDVKEQCPYYGRKARALDFPDVVTNMSYTMAEGMIPDEVEGTFGDRYKLFLDECQNVEDFAMSNIQFTVSKRTVPDEIWKNISIPPERNEDDMDSHIEWIRNDVLGEVTSLAHSLNSIAVMGKDETAKFEQLRQFKLRVENFLKDVQDHEWVADITFEMRKNKPNESKIVFKPVTIGRFLDGLLWQRGSTVILSSATIPGGDWLEEIGLSDRNVRKIKLGSTFPVENRKVICNLDVGKMVSTYSDKEDNRETNAWPMAKRIMELGIHHEGEKGFVHCRSYGIAQMLRRQYMNHGDVEIRGQTYSPMKWFHDNVMIQDQYNREESLEEWRESDTQVFLSVAMDEGVDLKGDDCRWQALAKVLYPFMTKRMERRKEIAEEEGNAGKFWSYYNRKAVIQMQQAYGRAVRSKDDEAVFYILDSSAKDLIQRNAEQFQGWFLEAIEGLRVDPDRGM